MRPRRVFYLLLILFTVCGLNSPVVQAAGFGKNKVQTKNLQWQVLNTPHFKIHYYDGAEELAVRAALIGERAYKEYANRLNQDLPWQIPFILYTSHNDFAQTNISDGLIGEGTGGFSEPLRNRVVLPYNGSHEQFVHVIRHELVHSFMFHMAFGDHVNAAGSSLFRVPLWFAEGIAEWLSSGWDDRADMYIRDATINDYLYPLEYVGGFMVYKQGQAAMRLLVERYGPDKLVDFWWQVGRSRSVDRALKKVYGLTMEDLNKLYRHEMRKRYWSRYAELEVVADIARPLTDHVKAGTFLNDMPAINPSGDLMVYYSDREGLVDLWLKSTLDGQIIRRLGRSRRSNQFESFHSFNSGPCFSPDGKEVALIAKSGNSETLHTIDISNGDITRSLQLGVDVAAHPNWSPSGESIVLTGTVLGRTDLYLVDLTGNAVDWPGYQVDEPRIIGSVDQDQAAIKMIRLTNDVGDETTPVWSPDGRNILFVFNSLAEIEYNFTTTSDGSRKLTWAKPVDEQSDTDGRIANGGSIVCLDLSCGSRISLFDQRAGIREPVWLDKFTLAAIKNTGGIENLVLINLSADRQTVTGVRRLTNVLGGLSHLSWSYSSDRLLFSAFNAAGFDIYSADNFLREWSLRRPAGQKPVPVSRQLPQLVTSETVPAAPIEEEKVGLVEPYSSKLTIDLAQALGGGAVYFSPDVGLGMANIVSLSDMLGDHRMRFLVNFYGSLENSDLAASYTYLKRRIDYGAGIFHYSNYYNSAFSSVGELLSAKTRFREINYGVYGYASYPLDTFRRFDFELQYLNSDRTNLEYFNGYYILLDGERSLKRLIQPSLAYTHDTALYGIHGPMAGTRWVVSASQTFAPSGSAINRFTGFLDYRRYWQTFKRSSFALHLSYAISDGDDPRGFVLGGPWTLRGYQYFDYQSIDHLAGTSMAMASLEYRFPLVDYLIFGWPTSWGISGIGATLFADAGSAWVDDLKLFGDDIDGQWGFTDLRGNFGVGLRANLMMLPMKFDWAWKTDLRSVEDVTFQFSIGPEF